MMASLIPDLSVEFAQILAQSASCLVSLFIVKGSSTQGAAIEVPVVMLTVLEGDRLTHIEVFDPGQRDLALARFEDLSRSG
jgi:hypothetical protein